MLRALFLLCTLVFTAAETPVTYSSAIYLKTIETKHFIYASQVQWSNDNNVYGVSASPEKHNNALWTIRTGAGQAPKPLGSPVKCGDIVRFENGALKKALHISGKKFPFSSSKEVVAQDIPSVDDVAAHNFIIECKTGVWQYNRGILIKSASENQYLNFPNRFPFNPHNCPNCPIISHGEISLTDSGLATRTSIWSAVPALSLSLDDDEEGHSEL